MAAVPSKIIRVLVADDQKPLREAICDLVAGETDMEEAEVVVAERNDGFLVRIADDGVGFTSEQSLPAPGHLGLAAMRERAELAGGTLKIDSAPKTGTTVECWIPIFARDSWNGDRQPGERE